MGAQRGGHPLAHQVPPTAQQPSRRLGVQGGRGWGVCTPTSLPAEEPLGFSDTVPAPCRRPPHSCCTPPEKHGGPDRTGWPSCPGQSREGMRTPPGHPAAVVPTEGPTLTALPWDSNCCTASLTASSGSISNSWMFSRTAASNVSWAIRLEAMVAGTTRGRRAGRPPLHRELSLSGNLPFQRKFKKKFQLPTCHTHLGSSILSPSGWAGVPQSSQEVDPGAQALRVGSPGTPTQESREDLQMLWAQPAKERAFFPLFPFKSRIDSKPTGLFAGRRPRRPFIHLQRTHTLAVPAPAPQQAGRTPK